MPTALQLSRKEWQTYQPRVQQQGASQMQHPQAQAELLGVLRQVGRRIRTTLGAKRVLLFGSLARDWFTDESDIDLAVEGLTGSQYWEAWRIAEDALPDRQIDFVELESASDSLRHAIEEQGVPL